MMTFLVPTGELVVWVLHDAAVWQGAEGDDPRGGG